MSDHDFVLSVEAEHFALQLSAVWKPGANTDAVQDAIRDLSTRAVGEVERLRSLAGFAVEELRDELARRGGGSGGC